MNDKRFHGAYIWQRGDWPKFRWDSGRLIEPLSRLSRLQGLLSGQMSMLGFSRTSQTLLATMTDDLVGSSEIEGLQLNPQSVRSSIARRLGIEDDVMVGNDRYVDGLVDVMLDASHNCQAPLTDERLFGWHSALFPTGRSGMYAITVGDWRKGDEPMRVVSGALGHERVHYEAPPSSCVAEEMDRFMVWCNSIEIHPALISGVAHLWFVTIHPFDDGNGRIGRTIADMFLWRLDGEGGKYYSVSAEINRNKKAYYEILEHAQKGDLDITSWLEWYLQCIEQAIARTMSTIAGTLRKTEYWERFRDVGINERQLKVINRLWDGFEGKMTSSKWAKICHCSQDTALRDINDLIAKQMLVSGREGGRSTHYILPD